MNHIPSLPTTALPMDLVTQVIRHWIFPSILQEIHQYTHRSFYRSVLEEIVLYAPESGEDEYIVTGSGTTVLLYPRKHFHHASFYLEIPHQDGVCLFPEDYFTVGYVDDVPDARAHTSPTIELHWHHGTRIYRFAKMSLLFGTSRYMPQRLTLPLGVLRPRSG